MTDVVRFIKLTDCAPLAKIFQEQVCRVCCVWAVSVVRLDLREASCFGWLPVPDSRDGDFSLLGVSRGGGGPGSTRGPH